MKSCDFILLRSFLNLLVMPLRFAQVRADRLRISANGQSYFHRRGWTSVVDDLGKTPILAEPERVGVLVISMIGCWIEEFRRKKSSVYREVPPLRVRDDNVVD